MTPEGERWRYTYDAFGQRIRKLRLVNSAPAGMPLPNTSEMMAWGNPPLYSAGSFHKKIQGYDYLWSGDQLIEETPVCADGTVAYGESIHWLYAPGALTPVARYEKGRLHYVVADHMGTPRELLNEQGKLVWATRLSTWGKAERWRQAAKYIFNETGRVITGQDYAGTQWHYAYDEDGNCTEKQNALKQVTRYGYDACCRLTAVTAPEGLTRYTYDRVGRLLSISSPEDELHYTRDVNDRVIREVSQGREIRRDYPDAFTVVRHLGAADDGLPLSTVFRYNRAGALAGVELPDAQQLTFITDRVGNECERVSPAGFIFCQDYNEMGMPVRQRAGRQTRIFRPEEVSDIPRPTLAGIDRAYQYDAALNLVSASDDNGSLNYVVNGNRQVVSVSQGRTLKEYYHYDASGCLTQRQTGEQYIAHDDIYQRGHRLRRLGQNWYEYDLAGRMTARRIQREGFRPEYTRFSWDSQDRLTGVKDAQGNRWQYRYDALGRRTEKRCEQKGLRITYLWDGDNIAEIREYRDGSLQKIRHWVFNGRELIAQQDCTYSAGSSEQDGGWKVETRFAVCAATGQPLALFNTAGECIWRRSPESLWGMAPERAGQSAQHDPGLKFAGQQWDAESGLHYNRFRYYDPQTGCYLTPDPIGLAGGENTYGYVPNPLGWVDPLGLAGCPSATAKLGKNSYKNFVDNPVKPDVLNPKDIRYMQSSIKNSTGDHTVLGNIESLKSGALKPEDLTKIKVWKDIEGNIWSLDHRRLAAFKESGLNSIPVEWATAAEVKSQAWKMSTKTNGLAIKLKLGNGYSMILGDK